jgi:hypothetical protein
MKMGFLCHPDPAERERDLNANMLADVSLVACVPDEIPRADESGPRNDNPLYTAEGPQALSVPAEIPRPMNPALGMTIFCALQKAHSFFYYS